MRNLLLCVLLLLSSGCSTLITHKPDTERFHTKQDAIGVLIYAMGHANCTSAHAKSDRLIYLLRGDYDKQELIYSTVDKFKIETNPGLLSETFGLEITRTEGEPVNFDFERLPFVRGAIDALTALKEDKLPDPEIPKSGEFCTTCGAKMESNWQFCNKCGASK